MGSPDLVTGKFGNGFRFPGPGGNGAITIANAADFNPGANQSFAVEAFVNVDPADDPPPRVVLIKGQVDAAGTLTASGWSLSVGSFRGIANNARWAASDGNQQLEAFADLNIADGRFHHLAGNVDRTSRRLRLLVDGEERADIDLSALAALTNAESIRIGRSAVGHAFAGVIDEVRFSRVARADFHPVLGEADDAYRERLGIFERWLLPTPDALLNAINSTVHIDGEAQSFVLVEKDRPIVTASKVIRIVPAALPAGQSIDQEGRSLSKESEVCGGAEDDLDFNPVFLLKHDRARVEYGLDPKRRLMQSATKSRLDALVDLLAVAASPASGNLVVEKAFDDADAGLHRVGRALLLRHESRTSEQLAALAHRAGFDFVRNEGRHVRASVAPGEKLEVVIEPRPANQTPRTGTDVLVGKAIDLALAPAPLPPTGQIKWTPIFCGTARAHFAVVPSDTARTPITSRPRVRLIADAPGTLTVRVEYAFARRVLSGTRTLRIGIESLADKATISASGETQVSEATAVGALGEVVNAIYLIASNVAGVDYGSNQNNRKMQLALEKRFNALLGTQPGLANGLRVLKAFDPNDSSLHRAGRALLLAHSAIPPERLGPLAHQAGFGFVRRQGAQIYCSVGPGEKIEIAHAADLSPLVDEVVSGAPVDLRARFDALPAVGDFNWSVNEVGRGRGSLDFMLRPAVRFTPREPGLASLNITYVEHDPAGAFPYAFEIKLRPELEARNATIPKHQYDLIMNILNFFHPIGVEVLTGNIRKRVVEVEQNPLKAFPHYTYPEFRI